MGKIKLRAAGRSSMEQAWLIRFGTVHRQYVRCGKPTCRCAEANGGVLHGPYYYHFERINGRQYKRYIPRAEVEAVVGGNRARCREEQERRMERQRVMARIREVNATLRAFSREYRKATL